MLERTGAAPTPDAGPASRPAPRPGASRLHGLDLARGLAVLGMFAAHTAMPPDLTLADPTTWAGVVNGRSAILFATLAGVSLALMSGRTTPPRGAGLATARRRVLVRAACLLVLGGLVQFLVTGVAVILEFYALLLAASVVVLHWRARRLFLLAAGLAVLTPPVRAALVGLESAGLLGSGGVLGQLTVSGTYPALVWSAFVVAGLGVGRLDLTRARVGAGLAVSGVLLAVAGYGGSWLIAPVAGTPGPDGPGLPGSAPYESSLYLDPGDGSTQLPGSSPTEVPGAEADLDGMVCSGAPSIGWSCYDPLPGPAADEDVADVAPEKAPENLWAANWAAVRSSLDLWTFTTSSPHSSTTFEVVGSGGVALTVIAACLGLVRLLGRLRWLVRPLTAVGSMPLTAYCGHLLALAVVGVVGTGEEFAAFEESSFGTGVSWTQWYLFAAVTLVLCTVWARVLGRGPLERLVAWVVRRAVAERPVA
ncbi:heparan-alpha-glucosaminide N-acetyltransferase domain-containing protein [Kineococcus sp. LSe6-4]|uniref:Heparan-alpha-glucosaminide N-acetyltransferase domain-containing protein n=1 Tax=Kineococcus halophytocola TaxID=3234027 RepID=A0ABV4H2M4_9ACTN